VDVALRQPIHAEGHGASSMAAGLDAEAQVAPLLAHRARIGEAGGRHEQRDRRVADAERREALELLGQLEAELVARHDRVDALDRHQVLGLEHGRRVGDERGAERLDLRARDGTARGGAVPTVAQQVLGARIEPPEQVEGRDRAARAGAFVAVEGDEHARAVVALGDARGDDPDDARVPAVGRQDVGGLHASLADLRLGLEEDPRLGVAALGVGPIELLGDRGGARGVVGEDELEPGVGSVEAPGRVDPRRQAKADRPRIERAWVDARDAQQRADARPLGGGQRAQPFAHQAPVLAAQRHAVSDRGQGDEVEVLVGVRGIAPRAGQQRRSELVRHAGRAQVRARVAADGRMDDRRIGQRAVGPRAVVIGHHDVHPRLARLGDLGHGGDSAVGGDEQARAARGQPLHRRRAQAVAVLGATGQVPVDLGAERPQRPHEDRRRAHPVDVVVAVHRDLRALSDVAQHERDRRVDAGEARRIVALGRGQPCARGLLLPQPTPHQDLRDREADAERALEGANLVDRGGRYV
jgi:hypothetical protein